MMKKNWNNIVKVTKTLFNKTTIINFIRKNFVFVVLVVTIIFFALASPYFFSYLNFMNIGRQVAVIGTIGAAVTMIIIAGNIDLSVGSIVGMTACAFAIALRKFGNLPIAIIIGLGVGVTTGLTNGLLTSKGKIPSFLATLSTMSIVFGIAMVITKTIPIAVMNPIFWKIFGDDIIGFLPASIIWMIVISIISHFLLRYTKFGRYVYVTGANRIAAIYSGINVNMVTITVFTLSGIFSSIGGFLYAARMHAARGTFGQEGLMLSVIAAVIIGGTSLYGGKGTIPGTLLGTVIIGVLNNGLILIGMDAYVQDIVRGIVIILAILISTDK